MGSTPLCVCAIKNIFEVKSKKLLAAMGDMPTWGCIPPFLDPEFDVFSPATKLSGSWGTSEVARAIMEVTLQTRLQCLNEAKSHNNLCPPQRWGTVVATDVFDSSNKWNQLSGASQDMRYIMHWHNILLSGIAYYLGGYFIRDAGDQKIYLFRKERDAIVYAELVHTAMLVISIKTNSIPVPIKLRIGMS